MGGDGTSGGFRVDFSVPVVVVAECDPSKLLNLFQTCFEGALLCPYFYAVMVVAICRTI